MVGFDEVDVDECVFFCFDVGEDCVGEVVGDVVGFDEDEGFFGGYVICFLFELWLWV